jgi:hypothetical protein
MFESGTNSRSSTTAKAARRNMLACGTPRSPRAQLIPCTAAVTPPHRRRLHWYCSAPRSRTAYRILVSAVSGVRRLGDPGFLGFIRLCWTSTGSVRSQGSQVVSPGHCKHRLDVPLFDADKRLIAFPDLAARVQKLHAQSPRMCLFRDPLDISQRALKFCQVQMRLPFHHTSARLS